MIRAEYFIQEMKKAGFLLYTGVPCSYLTPFIDTVIDSSDVDYIPAANEGDAVAIACGAEIGGKRAVVMFQNSGLGNAVSPLTSLTSTFRLPVLVITTWRGQPGGPADEPQHETMGRITPSLLELMEIPWELFPDNEEAVGPALHRALAHMETNQTPYALVMPYGIVEKTKKQDRSQPDIEFHAPTGKSCLPSPGSPGIVKPGAIFDQDEVLRTIQSSCNSTDAIVATTGFTGRALYALEDRENQFYMVGSMGCVSSFGLGLATVRNDRRIVVIDGDGALLMRMGALATNGFQTPANLLHIILDNGCHDSTGSQATVSSGMNLRELGLACGYPCSRTISDLDELADLMRRGTEVLTMVNVKTRARGKRDLPRPVISPPEVACRFRAWLGKPPIFENGKSGQGANT